MRATANQNVIFEPLKQSGAKKRQLKRDRLIKLVASQPGQLKISNLFVKSIETNCEKISSTQVDAPEVTTDDINCVNTMEGGFLHQILDCNREIILIYIYESDVMEYDISSSVDDSTVMDGDLGSECNKEEVALETQLVDRELDVSEISDHESGISINYFTASLTS